MQQRRQDAKYSVFCYGTLEFDAVMKKVTGATFAHEMATLVDYARYLVKNAPYPAVIAEAGAVTQGTLFHGLDARQISLLDEYEGELYQRIESEVLTQKGNLVPAIIYVVPEARRHFVSRLPWHKDEFEQLYLKNFCKTL